jgi:uncharacterized protein (TIGR02270 family)
MTQTLDRPPIPVVVQQHAEESAVLRQIRSVLVRAPHVRLRHLRRLDDRIAAHLDGLAVAGSYGTALCTAALERVGAGEVFALAVRVIAERDDRALDRLAALAAALPDARRGLLSAFGWVSAAQLQGLVQQQLASGDSQRRALAIAACRLHRADPGEVLAHALADADPLLRAAALRTAGELGRADLLEHALAALSDPDATTAYEAAACACLLGDRHAALDAFDALAHAEGPLRAPAREWLLLASDFQRARDFVRSLAKAAAPDLPQQRRVIAACGLLGDVRFVPWLVERMEDDTLARIAGESFSLLTGADLAALDLERKPPERVPGGPSDDPADDDVAMDPDDSLPWPDRARVERWWQQNADGMPLDRRSFMGRPPGREQGAQVLREGFQRQRLLAARHLCLLAPGTRLFPACAPAWRQQRLLAA